MCRALPSSACIGCIHIPWMPGWCCLSICIVSGHCRPGDAAYSLRWRLIKTFFCRALPPDEYRSAVRLQSGERGIWQRRYWEHLIRNEEDFRRHVDYVHVNSLKHGLVRRVRDWPFSSFHRNVRAGLYPADWAGDSKLLVPGNDRGIAGRFP